MVVSRRFLLTGLMSGLAAPVLADAAAVRLSDWLGRFASRTRLWPLARRVTDISLWVVRRSATQPLA